MTTRSFLLGLLLVVVVTAVPQSVSSRPSSSSASSSSACREECPKIYLPVCGSDGKTYSNKCLLDSASCKNANANRPRIDFQFEGECESAVEVSRDDCHRTCGNTYSPVCASNGNTYFNKCELSIATCRNSQITQRFEGVCAGTTSSSSAKRPSRDQRPASAPVVTDGCPTKCEGGFRPVCGTNNITYGSDCYLSIAMCKIPGLRKKDDGVCAKDCFLDCETTKNFVCGTNGVTYDNDCFLLLDRCKDPAVGFLHSGKCGQYSVPEEVEKCKRDRRSRCSSPRRSVCGSDGITYDSLCSLRVAACEKSWILRISDGPCQV